MKSGPYMYKGENVSEFVYRLMVKVSLMIAEELGVDFQYGLMKFAESDLFEDLRDPKTCLWQESAFFLYNEYKEEMEKKENGMKMAETKVKKRATVNITMRIDETLKAQLQELVSNLGLDMTTFFTMAAKQAVREQALPFQPNLNKGSYSINAYKLAMRNAKYNESGKEIIENNDEWKDESEWNNMFEQMKEEAENK
jgi:addiction module RelB/DinJ family antitoxin